MTLFRVEEISTASLSKTLGFHIYSFPVKFAHYKTSASRNLTLGGCFGAKGVAGSIFTVENKSFETRSHPSRFQMMILTRKTSAPTLPRARLARYNSLWSIRPFLQSKVSSENRPPKKMVVDEKRTPEVPRKVSKVFLKSSLMNTLRTICFLRKGQQNWPEIYPALKTLNKAQSSTHFVFSFSTSRRKQAGHQNGPPHGGGPVSLSPEPIYP